VGSTQYTSEQVESAIGRALHEDFEDDPEYVDWHEANEALSYGGTLSTPLGEFKAVAEEGGEGQGEDIWFVFRVVDTGQLFKKSGYYASHYGTDWDGPLEEVHAVERMVTFYE
jgi:hypothetical protein